MINGGVAVAGACLCRARCKMRVKPSLCVVPAVGRSKRCAARTTSGTCCWKEELAKRRDDACGVKLALTCHQRSLCFQRCAQFCSFDCGVSGDRECTHRDNTQRTPHTTHHHHATLHRLNVGQPALRKNIRLHKNMRHAVST